MTVIAFPKMTVEEYDALIALPENADRHLELLNGALIEEMPGKQHSRLTKFFLYQLDAFLKDQPLGETFVELRYRLTEEPHTALIPDVSYISVQKSQQYPHDDQKPVPFMPDLAIEIQSPGQSKLILTEKAHYYLNHGSRAVWLIYPDEQIIEVLTTKERDLLQPGKTLTGGEVLPGFSVEVAAIFA